jgi:hypothetical protein
MSLYIHMVALWHIFGFKHNHYHFDFCCLSVVNQLGGQVGLLVKRNLVSTETSQCHLIGCALSVVVSILQGVHPAFRFVFPSHFLLIWFLISWTVIIFLWIHNQPLVSFVSTSTARTIPRWCWARMSSVEMTIIIFSSVVWRLMCVGSHIDTFNMLSLHGDKSLFLTSHYALFLIWRVSFSSPFY